MMKHWTVTSKADGVACIVITENGKTPFDCGYDAKTYDAVALTPAKLRKRELDEKRDTLINAVKRVAAEKIEAIAPVWRQLNDLHDEPSPEAAVRKEKVKTERNRSNLVEVELSKAKSMDELLSIFDTYQRNEP